MNLHFAGTRVANWSLRIFNSKVEAANPPPDRTTTALMNAACRVALLGKTSFQLVTAPAEGEL